MSRNFVYPVCRIFISILKKGAKTCWMSYRVKTEKKRKYAGIPDTTGPITCGKFLLWTASDSLQYLKQKYA